MAQAIGSDRRPVARWVCAGAAAILASFVAVASYLHAPLGTPGPDIDQAWLAARAVLHGQDPYRSLEASHAFAFPLYYPLTTAIVSLPLAPWPLDVARLLFVGGTAALFGYAFGARRPYLWPTLLGMPFFVSVRSAQWAPLLTAAMLMPSLGWLAAAKPNLGVAMLAGARSWRDAKVLVLGGLAIVLVSLLVDPHWPSKWRAALAMSEHFRPLVVRPGGFLALLALFRWRDPDARLLIALAVVPVTGLAYDVLPACLVCRSRKQAAALAVASYAGWLGAPMVNAAQGFADEMWRNGELVLWCCLLPAVALVALRGVSWPGRRALLR